MNKENDSLFTAIKELLIELEKLEIDEIESSINETLDSLKKSCNTREYGLAFETLSWIKEIAIENKNFSEIERVIKQIKAPRSQANELQG